MRFSLYLLGSGVRGGAEALRVSGTRVTVDALMETLARDRAFWGPEGGVTFTGGEPLVQHAFLRAALAACHAAGIHTALETSLHADGDRLREIVPLVDFLFADIKHMDPAAHREGTGMDNARILSNLAAVARSGGPGRVVVRVPVVPGFNDSDDNLRATARFVAGLGLREVNLLPLHRLGLGKFARLGRTTHLAELSPPSPERMQALRAIVEGEGPACHVGSDTPY
jgi:pyruvate formate lyase activating enzyme